MRFQTLTEDPDKRDSPDITEEEVTAAVPTSGGPELFAALTNWVRGFESPETPEHELKRFQGGLFWRARLGDASLLLRVDWLDR